MARQVLRFLLLLFPALFFVECAQQGDLTGGKRDITPPRLIEAIPAQNAVNFNADKIVLKFDELVQLKDLKNQLVVSPKLKTSPEFETYGKTISISIKKDELMPNTTYKIYLGQALADINESNAIQNFEYVFSTGSHLDSLKVEVSIFDAFNNKPAANTIVALYGNKNADDSLPYREIPDYLGKSDANGKFTFSNLPYKKFKAYAYNDKNKNYLYDGETEQIAFLAAPLELITDTSIRFSLFQEEAAKGFIKKTFMPYYGFMMVILNKKSQTVVDPLKATDKTNIFETQVNKEKDTIVIYYKNVIDTLGLVLKNLSQNKTDTLKLSLPKKNAIVRKFKNYGLNAVNNTLSLDTKPVLTFSSWMDILIADPLRMKLSSPQDSLVALSPVTGNWLDVSRFEITNVLKEGLNYQLKIDTNAFFDVNGISNDSLSIVFKTQSKVEFGKVTLKMLFNKKQAYVIQLINEKDQVVKQAFSEIALSSSNAVSIEFSDVQPGTYLVKVIFDDNKNKKWDTGNLFSKRQPEQVIINSKQIKILSDWEIEEEIQVKD